MKQESITSPDEEHILIRVTESLKYINNFCKQNNLCVDDYDQHLTNNTPSFLLHLKERTLSFYVLLEMPKVLNAFKKHDNEVLKFMFGKEIFADLSNYKKKYYSSKTCKDLVRAGIAKIRKNSCF